MRWYFAIDEAGAAGETGVLARLAVLSARAAGGLQPVLLYHGAHGEFCAWMQAQNVHIIDTVPDFWPEVEAAMAAGRYRPHSIGHWLRLAIPQLEQTEDCVLYTDCDVIFLRGFETRPMAPKVFAAAPELKPDNWNYFNSGVMLINVPAMRATYPALVALIKHRIASGQFSQYDDQYALNEAYRGLWQRLDPRYNWKPYWEFERHASILHFHGPKPGFLEHLAASGRQDDNATAIFYEKLLNTRSAQYLAWCRYLGDFLQTIDIAGAWRFAALASALTRYRGRHAPGADTGFLELKIFSGDT